LATKLTIHQLIEKSWFPENAIGRLQIPIAQERQQIAAQLRMRLEIANHGLRWIHYQNLPEATEKRHVDIATKVLKELTGGAWPLGWYTGRDSPNTRRLVVEHGGYEYDSDYYGDDLPFWMPVEKSDGTTMQRLIVPYTLDTNDMRFASMQAAVMTPSIISFSSLSRLGSISIALLVSARALSSSPLPK